jgi:hypothetical protein
LRNRSASPHASGWQYTAHMKLRTAIAVLAILAAGVAHATPEILVTALHGMQWQVRYDFAEAVTSMQFMRAPDDSRPRTWLPDHGFEIVKTEAGDVARRKDGAAFRTVRFRMSPTYSVLPKDYAPFSPFGDGGMLFHTGRLFACAGHCSDDESWSMDLWADDEDRILLDGKALQARAHWKDSGEGRVVYVGKGRAQQTDDFVAVIDAALPDDIRGRLLLQLPRFMHLFSSKLGALPRRPMLFVSYDTSHAPGWGQQGGVLRDQVFTHFYGSKWPDKVRKPEFADELAWHLAHEAAHLYQRGVFAQEPGDAWIHEGAAEALAAIAMQPESGEFVRSTRETAASKCAALIGEKSIREAIAAGKFEAAYKCGMLLHLTVDARIRTATGEDGLYAVWGDYLGRLSRKDAVHGETLYLEAISAVGGADTAAWLRNAVATPGWRAD